MADKEFQSPTLAESGEVGGILLNDANGLCLAADGEGLDSQNSGVYTNLVRLASQLQPGGENSDATPLIAIEADESVTLCKAYHDHSVAVTIPSVKGKSAPSDQATDASQS